MSSPENSVCDDFDVLALRKIARVISLYPDRCKNLSALLETFTNSDDHSFAVGLANLSMADYKEISDPIEDIYTVIVPTFKKYLLNAVEGKTLVLPQELLDFLHPIREINPLMDFPGCAKVVMAYVMYCDRTPKKAESLFSKKMIIELQELRKVLAFILMEDGYDYLSVEFFNLFGFTVKPPAFPVVFDDTREVGVIEREASLDDLPMATMDDDQENTPNSDAIETPKDTSFAENIDTPITNVENISFENVGTVITPETIFSKDLVTPDNVNDDRVVNVDDPDVIDPVIVSITPLNHENVETGSTSTAIAIEDYQINLTAIIDELIGETISAEKITDSLSKMPIDFVTTVADFKALISVVEKMSVDDGVYEAVLALTKQVFFHLADLNEGLLAYWNFVNEKESPLTKVLFEVHAALSLKQLNELKVPEEIKNFAWWIVGDTGTTLRYIVHKAMSQCTKQRLKGTWSRLLEHYPAVGQFFIEGKSILMIILHDVIKTNPPADDFGYCVMLKGYSLAAYPNMPMLNGNEFFVEIMTYLTKPNFDPAWLNTLQIWLSSLKDGKITMNWNAASDSFDNPAVAIGAIVRLLNRSLKSEHSTLANSLLLKFSHYLQAFEIEVNIGTELLYENSDWSFKFCAVETIRDLIPNYHQEVPLSVYNVIPEEKRSKYQVIADDVETSFEKYLLFVFEVLAIHGEIPDVFVENVYTVYPDTSDIHNQLAFAIYKSLENVSTALNVNLARCYLTNVVKFFNQNANSMFAILGVTKELAFECQGLNVIALAIVRGIDDVTPNSTGEFHQRVTFQSLKNSTQKLINLFGLLASQLSLPMCHKTSVPWLNNTEDTKTYLEKLLLVSSIRTLSNCIYRRVYGAGANLKQVLEKTFSFIRYNSVVPVSFLDEGQNNSIFDNAQGHHGFNNGGSFRNGFNSHRSGQHNNGGNGNMNGYNRGNSNNYHGNNFNGYGGNNSNGFNGNNSNGFNGNYSNGFNGSNSNGFNTNKSNGFNGNSSNSFNGNNANGFNSNNSNGFYGKNFGNNGNGFNRNSNGYNAGNFNDSDKGNGSGSRNIGSNYHTFPGGSINQRKMLENKSYAPNHFQDGGNNNFNQHRGSGGANRPYNNSNRNGNNGNNSRQENVIFSVARNNPRGDADGSA